MESTVKSKLCEVIVTTRPELQNNFNILRRGYPKAPWSKQTKGNKFRKAAEDILKVLADRTMQIIGSNNKKRIVVLMPWRSGLAFDKSYRDAGVKRFYHLSSQRDEKTLYPIVDYEYGTAPKKRNIVIIADPMLATGNTALDAIKRMRRKDIAPPNIIVNSVIAAPVGIAKIKKNYPKIRIITGVLDKKLDQRGFIIPGLGDFGDKYFAEMDKDEMKKFIDSFELPSEARQKLKNRIVKHSVFNKKP